METKTNTETPKDGTTTLAQDRESILAAIQAQPGSLTDAGGDPAGDVVTPEAVKVSEGGQTQDKSSDTATPTKPDVKPKEEVKDPLADERKALEEAKARLADELFSLEQSRTYLNPRGNTPEDYEAVARKFEEEGNDELANKARAMAQETRTRQHTARLTAAHARAINEAVQKHPEFKDPNSSLFKRLDGVLKSNPEVFTYARGMENAIAYAVAEERASHADALQKKVSDLERKLAEAQKRLHPSPGGMPVVGSGEVEFDKLPLDKQRAMIVGAIRAGA